MRNLEEFKNIHAGQDIYIIASGASCDFIEPDFFSNKITIGVNQVYKKFKTTYIVRKEHRNLDEVLKDEPDTLCFVSLFNCGTLSSHKLDLKKYESNNLLCPYEHPDNTSKSLTKLPETGLIVSWSTITSGIHLAAYMGAKNIILVGHDCGQLDNKCNFNGYHTKASMGWKNGEADYKNWLPKIEGQTIDLKKLLKAKYGCNVYSLNPFINFGLEGHVYKKG
jgi:hypothetical protein